MHDEYEDAKSYSNETTLKSDLTADSYDKEIEPILKYLSGKVSGRLKRDGVYGCTITVSVKTGNFKRHSAQMKIDSSTDDDLVIYKCAKMLSDKLLLGDEGLFIRGEVIRLVGVGVSKLDDGSYRQLNLFDVLAEMPHSAAPGATGSKSVIDKEPDFDKKFQRQKKLDQMAKEIDTRYGKGTIIKGSTLK